ncbi:hypothetical protein B0I32_107281 [Nonomuraea fuscirosea]|uniref:Uncharacterized protein n=1 Tax=Nonomuraea fuscirosea TaxID=1291556 RepID=A0A2T0N158_9ACTN|nr:hypothetical protein B0I32_107281 [Nonomuraea fuscirosea]
MPQSAHGQPTHHATTHRRGKSPASPAAPQPRSPAAPQPRQAKPLPPPRRSSSHAATSQRAEAAAIADDRPVPPHHTHRDQAQHSPRRPASPRRRTQTRPSPTPARHHPPTPPHTHRTNRHPPIRQDQAAHPPREPINPHRRTQTQPGRPPHRGTAFTHTTTHQGTEPPAATNRIGIEPPALTNHVGRCVTRAAPPPATRGDKPPPSPRNTNPNHETQRDRGRLPITHGRPIHLTTPNETNHSSLRGRRNQCTSPHANGPEPPTHHANQPTHTAAHRRGRTAHPTAAPHPPTSPHTKGTEPPAARNHIGIEPPAPTNHVGTVCHPRRPTTSGKRPTTIHQSTSQRPATSDQPSQRLVGPRRSTHGLTTPGLTSPSHKPNPRPTRCHHSLRHRERHAQPTPLLPYAPLRAPHNRAPGADPLPGPAQRRHGILTSSRAGKTRSDHHHKPGHRQPVHYHNRKCGKEQQRRHAEMGILPQ